MEKNLSEAALPKKVGASEFAVIIECPYMAVTGQTEQQTAQLSESICSKYCGFWKDAQVLDQDIRLKYKDGEQRFTIMCFNPASPFLAAAKKKLEETGQI